MRVVTLSGWGQPHDALSVIAPDATHIDYARHDNLDDALADIASQSKNADMVIGWSLGGQLAVRAMAAGMFAPKKLVLIATPFQFVAAEKYPLGMGQDTFRKFRDNYARNPQRTLHKAWELIHKDDARAEQVRPQLERQDKKAVLGKNWLHWLDTLDGYSLDGENFADFPATLLIHGDKDAVVSHEQSTRLAKAIPQATLVTIRGAGHAPHWHDTKTVRQRIKEHAHV